MLKIKNIFNGIDTFLSLKNDYFEGNKNIDILSKLSNKCEENFDSKFCERIYTDILLMDHSVLDNNILFRSKLFFATKKLKKDDSSSILKLIDTTSEPESLKDAYLTLINYYKKKGDVKKEAKFYKQFSDRINMDSNILNGYAWRMTELKVNLIDALEKSIIAIDLASNYPENQANIIDTKAEILWILDRHLDAIETINLAIDINPESSYFRSQKSKFQNSLKE